MKYRKNELNFKDLWEISNIAYIRERVDRSLWVQKYLKIHS